MSKFKIELEVKEFKLKIDGERDEIPLIAENVAQQIGNLVEPAASIAQGALPHKKVESTSSTTDQTTATATKPRRKPRRRATSAPDNDIQTEKLLNWSHDPTKWGNPKQEWSVAEKCLWLLYVVKNELQKEAVPGPSLATTFNHHFKQAGRIHPPHATRDLGTLKNDRPSPIGEDSTKTPSEWFLTEEGNRRSQELCMQARGETE